METALEHVLEHGGRPVTWQAPNAVIKLTDEGNLVTSWSAE